KDGRVHEGPAVEAVANLQVGLRLRAAEQRGERGQQGHQEKLTHGRLVLSYSRSVGVMRHSNERSPEWTSRSRLARGRSADGKLAGWAALGDRDRPAHRGGRNSREAKGPGMRRWLAK